MGSQPEMYVVTADDRDRYGFRQIISQPMTRARAERFKENLLENIEISEGRHPLSNPRIRKY